MTYAPTPEQQLALEAFATGDDLVIQAGAGTGKTSTLRMLGESAPRRRGLYVAYNRAIAQDAKATFPRQVSCSTAHSLAFRAVGHQYKDRLDGPRQPARVVAQLLDIVSPLALGTDVPILSPQQTARIVSATVAKFCRSADRAVEAFHVPAINGFTSPAARTALAAAITPLARHAWEDLTAPNGQLKFVHDHYLKIWQLTYPRLPADYVLLDEAQDADPVIASIVGNQQHAQRIAVGDSAQAIYEWRGALDAMAKWPGKRLTLSKSFRFGPAIAAEANKWLDELGAPLRLEGHEPIQSRLERLAEPHAILTRSNAGAMREVMTSLAQGRRTALVGGGQQIRSLATAAISLKQGRGTDHPELFAFRTWGEVQDYVLLDESGSDLRTMVRLIDDYGADTLIEAIDHLVEETPAGHRPMALTTAGPEVVVSTAHKAKGREWPTVKISDDFHPPKTREDGVQDDPDPAELRLAYVAVTRARDVLDRGALAWIDTLSPRLPIPGPQRAADSPAPISALHRIPNASSTPHAPAQPLPAGIYCGPGGRVSPDELAPGDKWHVERFARFLTERQAIKDEYATRLAALQPGEHAYAITADERASRLQTQMNEYEADTKEHTR